MLARKQQNNDEKLYTHRINFCSLNVFAQAEKVALINKQINEALSFSTINENFKFDKVPDSVAFYAFSIKIKAVKLKDSTIIKQISVNDSIAYLFYNDFSFLKKINFTPIFGKLKEATLIIPVGFIIESVSKPKTIIPNIKNDNILVKISNMFGYERRSTDKISGYIYLDPVMCLCSTIKYD